MFNHDIYLHWLATENSEFYTPQDKKWQGDIAQEFPYTETGSHHHF